MNIKILFIYLSAVIAWSTTALGIQLSSETLHPLTSVYYRLTITTLLGIVILRLFKITIPWDKVSIKAYTILGTSVGGGLTIAYFGFQDIPSGLGAVIFGLSPIFVIIVERGLVPNARISLMKSFSAIVGLMGLAVIFIGRNPGLLNFDAQNDLGGVEYSELILSTILLMLSMVVFNIGAVILKSYVQENQLTLNPLTLSIGGFGLYSLFIGSLLLLMIPSMPTLAYGPEQTRVLYQETLSILYLAIVGSIAGFCSYNYIVLKVSVQAAAMVNFITPITALFLGVYVNNEVIIFSDYAGAGLVLFSILIYVFGDQALSSVSHRYLKDKTKQEVISS